MTKTLASVEFGSICCVLHPSNLIFPTGLITSQTFLVYIAPPELAVNSTAVNSQHYKIIILNSRKATFRKKVKCKIPLYAHHRLFVTHMCDESSPRKMSVNTHRPCEAEGEADRVGEAVRVSLGHLERVGAEDGSHGPAVGAGRIWGDAGLIVLQTDPKESLAFALLLALRVSGASGAAVGIPRYPFLVKKLLQLELKNSGAQNLQRQHADTQLDQRFLHTGNVTGWFILQIRRVDTDAPRVKTRVNVEPTWQVSRDTVTTRSRHGLPIVLTGSESSTGPSSPTQTIMGKVLKAFRYVTDETDSRRADEEKLFLPCVCFLASLFSHRTHAF